MSPGPPLAGAALDAGVGAAPNGVAAESACLGGDGFNLFILSVLSCDNKAAGRGGGGAPADGATGGGGGGGTPADGATGAVGCANRVGGGGGGGGANPDGGGGGIGLAAATGLGAAGAAGIGVITVVSIVPIGLVATGGPGGGGAPNGVAAKSDGLFGDRFKFPKLF